MTWWLKSQITGRHCCKDHAKVNRKMENSPICKTVTLKILFIFNFGSSRYSGGISPNRWNITVSWCSWLSSPVLFLPFSRSCALPKRSGGTPDLELWAKGHWVGTRVRGSRENIFTPEKIYVNAILYSEALLAQKMGSCCEWNKWMKVHWF